MVLTEDQKVAHLLRRFGLGASHYEMAEYKPLGVEGTLAKLIDAAPEPDTVHPFRFAFREGEDAEPGAWRLKSHWVYQLLTTKTPLREKLAIFWHDHFAVDEESGGDGLMMLQYMNVLRSNPTGKFGDLLENIAKNPSFMAMLTMTDSTRAHPNENFARELFELYTLGVGHYSENDIKEAARCFTGWSSINRYWSVEGSNNLKLELMEKYQQPYCGFCFSPEFFDSGQKSVLGKTANFTGEALLRHVAMLPRCAEFICGKLWSYFAYPTEDRRVLEPLINAYLKSEGSIRAVLYAIGRHSEFYGEKSYRQKIKSPVDYLVGICRAMNSMNCVPPLVGGSSKRFNEPLSKEAMDSIGGVTWMLGQCGMNLLMPPNVAGWDWGEDWINTNTMMWRMKFGGILTWEPKDPERKKWGAGPCGQQMLDWVKNRKIASLDALVMSFLIYFDTTLSDESYQSLKSNFEKHGGMQPLQSGNDEWLFGQLWNAYELLRAAPAFQTC